MKRNFNEFISDIFEKVRVYELSSDDVKKYVMVSNIGNPAEKWYSMYEKNILDDLKIGEEKWAKKSVPVSIVKKMNFPDFHKAYDYLTCQGSYGVSFPLLTPEQKEKKSLEVFASFGKGDFS